MFINNTTSDEKCYCHIAQEIIDGAFTYLQFPSSYIITYTAGLLTRNSALFGVHEE
jgi:hypothetical protein